MTATYMALAGVLTATLLLTVLQLWRRPDWTGFAARTLWDWISLLAVPLVVGFATVLINAAQHQIANERAAEAAFQQYIDRITALVLEAPESAAPQSVNAIGRAQTMAVLRLVDGERAGRVLAFLAEMDLLRRFSVSFEGIDLSGAELKEIDFGAVDFEGAELAGADMEEIEAEGADFENADLTGADLKGAILREAGFERADLSRANLSGADLRGADLSEARGLSARQLGRACYDRSTALPPVLQRAGDESEGCRIGVIDDD